MEVFMKFMKVCFLCLIFTTGIVEGCPVGWTRISDNSCYLLRTSPLRTPDHARLFCQVQGASVPVFSDNKEELDRVYEWLAAIDIYDIWLGLDNTEDEVWLWDNGEQFDHSWFGGDRPYNVSNRAGAIYIFNEQYGILVSWYENRKKTLCQLFVDLSTEGSAPENVTGSQEDTPGGCAQDGELDVIMIILTVVITLLVVFVLIVIAVLLKRHKKRDGINNEGSNERKGSNNPEDSVNRRQQDERDGYEVLDGGSAGIYDGQRTSAYDSVAMAGDQRASAYDSVRAAPVQNNTGATGYVNEAMHGHMALGQETSGTAPHDLATYGRAPHDLATYGRAPHDLATSGTAPLDVPRRAVPSTVSDADSYLHVYDYSGAGPREPPKLRNQ